ncbi:Hint domain-containing protein [Roseovarius sp. SYSU LYC5161]|uniref:Hint domain-containing protein n=1 Tax=Roseovarius halophilus (ex Wu et al. 2025) TaxID=3376060 RepID=UPI00399C092B
MAFQDVIDDYSNGHTGTINTQDGTVGYTIIANVDTISRPNTNDGAQVSADGSETVEVAFDDPVRGVSIKFDRSNQPEIYKIKIDGEEVDIQELVDSGDATFTTVMAGTDPPQPGTHVIEDGGVTSTGSYGNGSLGFLTMNRAVENLEVFGTGGTGGNWDLIEIGIDSVSSAVVCFVADTELQTPQGDRKVCELEAGDQIITQTGKSRTIVATNVRHVRAIELYREPRLLPIRIAAGALGGGVPERDLLVSRQHRILVASRIARRICGQEEVLIAAFRLVGLPGIEIVRAIEPVSYHHIMLDRHEIILANGAPAETLFVGSMSATVLRDQRQATLPETHLVGVSPAMIPARPFQTGKKAKKIIAAHKRHQRPLLETRLCISA